MKKISYFLLRLSLVFLVSIHLSAQEAEKPAAVVGSMAELMDLPASQYQRGILANILYANLNRYAMNQNLSNALQGRNFNLRVLLREEPQHSLQLDAYLFSGADYKFTAQDIEMVAANLASELGNCFAFFDRRLDLEAIQGRILLHSAEGQLISTHAISDSYARFIARHQRQTLVAELAGIAAEISKQSTMELDFYVQRIATILATIGWPAFSLDGAEVSHQLMQMLLQLQNVELQKLGLQKLLNMPVDEIDLSHIAILSDVILLAESQEQWYGTQYEITESGQIAPRAIQEASQVDTRRSQLGLVPLSEYLETELTRRQMKK